MKMSLNSDFELCKYDRGYWKKLPNKGDSVGINDPKLKVGYIGNLSKKSSKELSELYNRQKCLLSNKVFISKLEDGGQKLKHISEEISKAYLNAQQKEKFQALNSPFLKLHNDLNFLEWRKSEGKFEDDNEDNKESNGLCHNDIILDSDDDSDDDALKLMASQSYDIPVTNRRKNKLKHDDCYDPAIAVEKELEKLEIQDKIDSIESELEGSIKKSPFKPFRLVGREHLELTKPRNSKLWEESSATGPLKSSSSKTVVLPMKESLELLNKMKERDKDKLVKKVTNCHGKPDTSAIGYKDINKETHILFEDYLYSENMDQNDFYD